MSTADPTRPTGAVLHGGAQRLPVRVHNPYDAPATTISRYLVAPGDRCTLHVHTGKTEAWVITQGTGTATVGDVTIAVREGDIVVTPPGRPHDLVNLGQTPLVFVNVVLPTHDAPITTRELEV
ncbi:cupin domain-containing protein [uncultured Alsobacter sp.]|uniref:cupin domain-containing protein n=1 Tax=uncultured Alsobacter sp. TaxID=1748258 RepID=UPI0025F93333|nr:cupin domain-containing protein [uncultured Alsobacter sp.]